MKRKPTALLGKPSAEHKPGQAGLRKAFLGEGFVAEPEMRERRNK